MSSMYKESDQEHFLAQFTYSDVKNIPYSQYSLWWMDKLSWKDKWEIFIQGWHAFLKGPPFLKKVTFDLKRGLRTCLKDDLRMDVTV